MSGLFIEKMMRGLGLPICVAAVLSLGLALLYVAGIILYVVKIESVLFSVKPIRPDK